MSQRTGEETLPVRRRQPSLRRRLLKFLLIPTLVLMLLDTGFVYFVALRYSNAIHDRDLISTTLGLANAIASGRSGGRLPREARSLLEYNPDGRTLFSVRSLAHGVVSASTPAPPSMQTPRARQVPIVFDAAIAGLPVRVGSVRIASPTEPGDSLLVSVAESLHARQQQAREILMITIPVEALLIAVLLALVWQGVKFGLRILDLPTRRLALRERNLEPVSGPDIPVEILPLTRTIDGLFERVRVLIAFQERFVADAAHQLRTPLAGLAMHVERASSAGSHADFQSAMTHIQALTARTTRTATQLLSLARAQTPQEGAARLSRIDLGRWLPEVVAARIPESLHIGVDLGYEAATSDAIIDGEQHALQELFDNLIDNALRHVAHEGTVTMSLHAATGAGQGPRVAIDDDGPGVPDELLSRLGERFFQAPGAADGGSGLGLAIVRRIADIHGARLGFSRSALGGLRVELRFPAISGAEA